MGRFEHGDHCPICAGVCAGDGLEAWPALAACAMSGFANAIELWRATPANSRRRAYLISALTDLHNALADHAEHLDPERFRISRDEYGHPMDIEEMFGDE